MIFECLGMTVLPLSPGCFSPKREEQRNKLQLISCPAGGRPSQPTGLQKLKRHLTDISEVSREQLLAWKLESRPQHQGNRDKEPDIRSE